MASADVILHNGQVVTMDSADRVCEAVAVRSDRVMEVGPSADVLRRASPTTQLIDLKGSTVTPGFFDAHPHMDREGLRRIAGTPIGHCSSIAEIQEVVAKAAATKRAGDWILLLPLGHGPHSGPHSYVSSPDQLKDKRFPNRYDLDEAAPDNPVYIRVPWGWWTRPPFPAIANSAALERAGIGRDTRAPFRTEIVRDDAGEPTGVFLERNFAPILEYTLFRCVPRFNEADRVASVAEGSAAYSAAGTTSMFEGHGITPALLTAFIEARDHAKLWVRSTIPLSIPTAAFDNDAVEGLLCHWADRLAGDWGDEMLRTQGICLDVGDPDLARIISRHYPYEQWAGHYYQSLPHDRLVEVGEMAARLGIRVNSLVCYDLERVLSAYEEINRRVGIRDRRWSMIHVVDASDSQIKRMRELGVIATVTPNFMFMANDRFGIHALRERAVPIRRLLDGGVPVALSSDGVPYSMLWTMWEALARWDDDSQSRLGPSDLSREEALRLTVQTGYQLSFSEDRYGSIQPGKIADLVVLEDNPLTCPEDRIKDIRVLRTMLGGREVYNSQTGNSAIGADLSRFEGV